MTKNTIADYLIDGEIGDKLMLLTDELKRLLTATCQAADKLTATLTSEQKSLFETFCNIEADYHLENLYRYFSEGFKAGLKVGLEVGEW